MERFLKDATVVTTAVGLWDIFVRFMQSSGIEFISYIQFAAGNIAPSHHWGRLPGFPEGWIEQYNSDFWEVDPVRSLAALSAAPFRWRQVRSMRTLSSEEQAFLDEVDRYSPVDGLIVPVFGPGRKNGYIALGLPDRELELPPLILGKFRVTCQYMHQRYCELVPSNETPTVNLSKREREVLRWVARGKSNSVIADILGVSSNTVDTHLRRIYGKLNVSDRVSAALAGLATGFITLK